MRLRVSIVKFKYDRDLLTDSATKHILIDSLNRSSNFLTIELTVRLEALSNILTIVMNALSQSNPSLHANIINNIEEFAESMRNSLGEVDEEDISAYAHSVADSMEEFLPLTEDEINSIEFMK
uniref:Uncharacterized protein n=1 Tax=Pectobacterium carotovorum TaxID=554 RepID=A0A0N9NKW9_PECCA|nr:hypothetical protein [Pectobacterium carotovorum]ALG88433.1 Hypothetical protein [Pectobacterium carotovorum]